MPPAKVSDEFPAGENDDGVLGDATFGGGSIDKDDEISRNSTAPEAVPSLHDEVEGEGNKDRSPGRHTDCPGAPCSIFPPSGLSEHDVEVSDNHDPEGSSYAGKPVDHAEQAFARLQRARERALLSSCGGICLSGVGDPSVPSQVIPPCVGADGTVIGVDGGAVAWAESGDAARLAGYNTIRRVCEAYRLENDFDHAWEAVLGRIVQVSYAAKSQRFLSFLFASLLKYRCCLSLVRVKHESIIVGARNSSSISSRPSVNAVSEPARIHTV